MSVNKKKLPKAIRQTTGDRREAAVRETARAPDTAAPPATEVPSPSPEGALAPVTEVPSPSPEGALAPVTEVPSPSPEGALAPVTEVPSPSPQGALAPVVTDPFVVRRRSLARGIVERHAYYSAVGGIIPVPIANVASITAVIVRMVKVLSDLYGVPFQRDRARAIVVGLMGGAMPTGLAAVTASTLVYLVPGSNLIGLAVSSVTAIACTRGIGRVFIEHFESGATLNDISAVAGK